MKIKEAFDKVLKTKENESCADIDNFSEILGLNFYIGWSEEFDNRVKGYYLWNWMCTDTVVGGTLYFFDGKPLAFGFQSARKSGETIKFYSKEIAEELRSFIISLAEDEEVDLLNLEEEISDSYSIQYAGQLMCSHKFGKVGGEPVEIHRREADPLDYICKQTVVKHFDGSFATVNTKDIEFSMHTQVN